MYVSVMWEAVSGGMLADTVFPDLRRTVGCGLELEHGEKGVKKVGPPAERLRAIFNDEKEVNGSRLVKKFEIRLRDIDDSVTLTAAISILSQVAVPF